jgi:hypothetical protein
MEKEYSILDAYLLNNNYIVLFSGLDSSPINTVVKELCQSFNGTLLDYMHLDFDSDLKVINDRVQDLIKQKKQLLFIKAKSFNKQNIKIPIDIHINLSIGEKQINDIELSNKYKAIIKENYIHKYFNFKQDTNIDDYINNIFSYIIDDIEKKLYKDKYSKLSHKFYEKDTKDEYNSTLMYNPKSLDKDDWNNKALKEAEEELDSDLNLDDDSDEDVNDMLYDSVLVN